MNTIGERVKKARTDANLTQLELAKLVGISKAAISQIENGSTKSPAAPTLLSICTATGFSPHWIIKGKGDPQGVVITLDHEISERELELLWDKLSDGAKRYITDKMGSSSKASDS